MRNLIRHTYYLQQRDAQKANKLPSLLFVTDRHRVVNNKAVIASLPQHSMVIIRDYDHPDRENFATEIAKWCRQYKKRFLVAGDATLAIRLNADGLHIPEHSWGMLYSWKKKKPNWIVTSAVHSVGACSRAARYGLDAVLYSPIFTTKSDRSKRPLGVIRFMQQVQKSLLPVYGLGGIDDQNIRYLKHAPIAGIATISGIAE